MTNKPYVFNNYEKTLPEQPRGHYRSQPVGETANNKQLKKSDGVMMTVDLTSVKDKAEVCERFYAKLGFFKGNGPASWDALGDYLWFFPESSGIFNDLNPAVVHLRIKNLSHLWQFSDRDYTILCEILAVVTDNSRFDDGFRMIVEVIND